MAISHPKQADSLESIPWIGRSLAADLRSLGYVRASDLKNQHPEQMYRDLCELRGTNIDRCVLYAFRCAVYFANNTEHEPELLKWWSWKDRESSAT